MHRFCGFVITTFAALAAYAQDAAPGGAAPGAPPPTWTSLVPIVAMLGFMYFFMMRPHAKRMKQRQDFIKALKRGDQVVTGSGIFGRVEGITDDFITLEIADGVRVKMLKAQVVGSATKAVEGAREART